MQAHNVTTQKIHGTTLTNRILVGAAIGLVVIAVFLFGVKNANPAWGKYWMIRPLIMVPLAGAMGGLFYYFMDYLRYQGGWKKAVAIVVSIVGFLFALWIGTILGLDGTLWD